MGLTQIAATGVSLSSLSCAATVGMSTFAAADSVDFAAALCIALPSMVGVRVGVRLAERMSSEAQALVFNGMSVVLIPTHLLVQRWASARPGVGAAAEAHEKKPDPADPTSIGGRTSSEASWRNLSLARAARDGGFGLGLGTLSAVMGVGGLPLAVSYLTLSSGLPHHLVQGTAMAACLPAILTSAASLGLRGHTPLATAVAVATGSMAGSAAGAQFALSLSEDQLRAVYVGSLVLLGGRSFVAAVGNASRLAKGRWKI